MSSWSVKFVVGANPELGGNKLNRRVFNFGKQITAITGDSN